MKVIGIGTDGNNFLFVGNTTDEEMFTLLNNEKEVMEDRVYLNIPTKTYASEKGLTVWAYDTLFQEWYKQLMSISKVIDMIVSDFATSRSDPKEYIEIEYKKKFKEIELHLMKVLEYNCPIKQKQREVNELIEGALEIIEDPIAINCIIELCRLLDVKRTL